MMGFDLGRQSPGFYHMTIFREDAGQLVPVHEVLINDGEGESLVVTDITTTQQGCTASWRDWT